MTNPNDPISAVPDVLTLSNTGITKLEYFSAMAMMGLCSHDKSWSAELIAGYAVEQARAMIEELNKESK